MLFNKFEIWTSSVIGLLAIGLSASAQTHQYDVTDLGVLPGQTISEATGINASGVVVGVSGSRPFIYHSCGARDIGVLSGGSSATPNAINDQGMIAGYAEGADMATHAVSWYGGSIHLLQPGATYQSAGFGVSAPGKVVGYEYGSGVSVATAYVDDLPVSVPSDDDPRYGWGSVNILNGANSSGQMTGYRVINNNFNQLVQILGLVMPAGSTSWVRITPPAAFDQYVYPQAINENGAVAGSAGNAAETVAFLSTDPKLIARNLGTLGGSYSYATALNNVGWVVGTSATKAGAQAAFLYDGQHLVNLNTTLTNGAGWALISAAGINDWGEIVGYGTHNGLIRGFLLSPSNKVIRKPPLCIISFQGIEESTEGNF